MEHHSEMAVISDSEIENLCSRGILISSGFNPKNVTPNGYDLTVEHIRIGSTDYSSEVTVEPSLHFLVSTKEFISMPPDICAQMWIRSSLARKGIIGSFGFIDAGFRGNLTLSLYNSSKEKFMIAPETRIAQIVFLKMNSPSRSDYETRSGNYQGSVGIQVNGRKSGQN
jgi:dCTP deaminase